MKIAIVNLTGGELSGGSKKYLQHVVPLARRDPRVERVEVFVPDAARQTIAGGSVEPFSTWSSADARAGFPKLKARLTSLAPDVVFVPNARFISTEIPSVVMVRNMEPLTGTIRNSWSDKARAAARRFVAWRACARADRVIAVSQHVSEFLTTRWRVPAGKIGIVYHGVDAAERPAVASPAPPMVKELEGLRFLFTAGSIRPARGLEDAIRALKDLKIAGGHHHLAIAGRATSGSRGYEREMRNLAESCDVADRAHWVGQLDANAMSWCFANCETFVMTSRTEACPNVVLESLSYGCVSVSTDSAPMPEFYQNAAAYYSAGDGASLASVILDVDQSRSRRDELRANAFNRAAQFDWRVTAERTIGEFEVLLKSRRTHG